MDKSSKNPSANQETPRSKRAFDQIVSPNSLQDEQAGAPKPTRRRNSIGSLKEVIPTSKSSDPQTIISHKGKTFDLAHLVHMTLSNESFVESIAPTLIKGIQPVLSDIINKAVERSTETMLSRLDEQSKAIENLNREIKKKNETIDNLNSENQFLKTKLDNLETQNLQLSENLDYLEQYGRRNSLRFHNVPVAPDTTTDEIIESLVNDKLEPTQPISANDIERSHFIGKPANGRAQIICKFKTWKTKADVYKSKSQLKHENATGKKIFVSEDLTKPRQAVVKALSEDRKAGSIHSYWTYDGRIFYKRTAESRPVLVKSVFSNEM